MTTWDSESALRIGGPVPRRRTSRNVRVELGWASIGPVSDMVTATEDRRAPSSIQQVRKGLCDSLPSHDDPFYAASRMSGLAILPARLLDPLVVVLVALAAGVWWCARPAL